MSKKVLYALSTLFSYLLNYSFNAFIFIAITQWYYGLTTRDDSYIMYNHREPTIMLYHSIYNCFSKVFSFKNLISRHKSLPMYKFKKALQELLMDFNQNLRKKENFRHTKERGL